VELKLDKKYLFDKTEPWDFQNPPMDVLELSESMVAHMFKWGGIGLAANQVGIPYSFFCMRGWGGPHEDFVILNPRIVHSSDETIELEEACLSYPGLVIKRTRPKDIRLRFQSPSGETHSLTFQGILSRTVQHEIDHLQGNPFWDTVSKLKFDRALKKGIKKGFPLEGIKYK